MKKVAPTSLGRRLDEDPMEHEGTIKNSNIKKGKQQEVFKFIIKQKAENKYCILIGKNDEEK
jgi:hypothetical protein